MTVRIEQSFGCSADQLWDIVGTPDRADWVPGVESIEFDGEVRRFKMQGAGDLAERIVLKDDARRRLEYSVVESTPPLASHLASIQVEDAGAECLMIWTTDVEPSAVEPFIEQGMKGSIEQLKRLL